MRVWMNKHVGVCERVPESVSRMRFSSCSSSASVDERVCRYGVATISRLLTIIGLFCRI